MDEGAQLLKEFLSGKPEAFTELVEKYKEPVLKIIYPFFPGKDEADDIAQEVFLKVYFNANKFQQKSSFHTWLYRITVNECYDALKKRKIKAVSLDDDLGESSEAIKDRLPDPAPSPAEKITTQELQKNIRQAIRSLPRKYALPVFLIDLNRFTYLEAADILKISVNKLKVWLYRGRKQLREKLIKIFDMEKKYEL